MKRTRRPVSFPITFDLLGLMLVLTLMYLAPDDRRARFGRDLGALITRHSSQLTDQQQGLNPDSANDRLAEFGDAVRNGARGIQSLYSIPAHGYQPFREYERSLDREFDDTLPPRENPWKATESLLQGTGASE